MSLKFEYNLFVGEHMSEPLRVKYKDSTRELTAIEIKMNGIQKINYILYSDDCIPQIRTPKSLSDEEWLFVFCGDDWTDYTINKPKSLDFVELLDRRFGYRAVSNTYDKRLNRFMYCDQQLLNRMYSLFCHPNAEELIAAGLAEELVG